MCWARRPTIFRSSRTRASARRLGADAVDLSGSAKMSRTVMRGIERRERVLKDHLHVAANRLQPLFVEGEQVNHVVSSPLDLSAKTSSKERLPTGGLDHLRIVRPTVVLPQPDFAHQPERFAFANEKLTPSTALTWPTFAPQSPLRIGKYFCRGRALRTGRPGAPSTQASGYQPRRS